MRWRLLSLAAVLTALFLLPQDAFAHAELLGSDPPTGSSLEHAPAELRLFFSEAVAPGLTDMSLLDARGRRIERVQARIEPESGRVLSAAVGDLQPGVYTLSYRALSAIDGHIDRGVVTFAVGTTDPVSGLAATEVFRQRELWMSAVLRWFSYLAALLLLGLSTFRVFVVSPHRALLSSEQQRALNRDLARFLSVSAVVLAFSSIAQLLQQSSELADDASLGALFRAMEDLFVRTRYGAIWLARIALGVAVLGLIRAQHELPESERSQRWGGAVILAGLALYTFAALSHSASALDNSWLGALLSWLHLMSIAVWFGGVVGLTVSSRVDALGGLVPRFSGLALVAFAVVVLSGFGQSLVLVGDPRAAFGTLAGQLLIAKVAVVAGVMALAWHARKLVLNVAPAIIPDSLARVERNARLEIRLSALALGITAVLVYLPPAWQTYQQQLRGWPLQAQTIARDLIWTTRIEPGRPGQNELILNPPEELRGDIASGRVVATFQDGDLPPLGSRFDLDDWGVLRNHGSTLSVAGRWLLESVVRLENGEDILVRTTVELAGPGTPAPRPPILRGGAMTASIIVSLGLVGLGLGLLLFVVRTLGTHSGEARGLIAATLAIVLLGGYVAVRPAPSEAVTSLNLRRSVSPISPTEASVAQGKDVYARACAECHGANGSGDGPRALSSGERLTDLRVHLSAGHTDGDLYYWITNGISGTGMPGFAEELSDDDRWHLVNAIRAMAADPT